MLRFGREFHNGVSRASGRRYQSARKHCFRHLAGRELREGLLNCCWEGGSFKIPWQALNGAGVLGFMCVQLDAYDLEGVQADGWMRACMGFYKTVWESSTLTTVWETCSTVTKNVTSVSALRDVEHRLHEVFRTRDLRAPPWSLTDRIPHESSDPSVGFWKTSNPSQKVERPRRPHHPSHERPKKVFAGFARGNAPFFYAN